MVYMVDIVVWLHGLARHGLVTAVYYIGQKFMLNWLFIHLIPGSEVRILLPPKKLTLFVIKFFKILILILFETLKLVSAIFSKLKIHQVQKPRWYCNYNQCLPV